MPRFLIEFEHSTEYEGCLRAVDAIMKYGSHIITNADWGCQDGVPSGWLIVELDSREEAAQLVPPQYRADSRVVQLNRWSREEIDEMVREFEEHGAPPSG